MSQFAYDVLDAWDLFENVDALGRYSMSDWGKVARALDENYPTDRKLVLGACHLGLTDGIRVARGDTPANALALPLLFSERVWLPDPVFTFFSKSAAEAWRFLPDSGSAYFTGRKGTHQQPSTLWTVNADQRRSIVRKALPTMLARLAELRPLVETGAVQFLPWEQLFLADRDRLRVAVNDVAAAPVVEPLTTRFLQKEYNLGPYLGAIGIEVSENQPPDSPLAQFKPGTPMWWEEKRTMLLLGFLNAAFSANSNALFHPKLPGDRVVYDFVRSGGEVEQSVQTIIDGVELPTLAGAAWPEIVAIRRNSQALSVLRDVVREASGTNEASALPAIRDRLTEASKRLRAETSTWRNFKAEFANTTIQTAISGVGGYLAVGLDLALVTSIGAAAAGLILSWARAQWNGDKRRATAAAELLVGVADRT